MSLLFCQGQAGLVRSPCPACCGQEGGWVWDPGTGASPWLHTRSPSRFSHCASPGCPSCSWGSRAVEVRWAPHPAGSRLANQAHSPLKGNVLGIKLCGDYRCSEPAQHLLLGRLGGRQQQLPVLPGQCQSLCVYHPAVMVNLHDHSTRICQPKNSTCNQSWCGAVSCPPQPAPPPAGLTLAPEDEAAVPSLPGHVVKAQEGGVYPQVLPALPYFVGVARADLGH